jgi:hypothetical protein
MTSIVKEEVVIFGTPGVLVKETGEETFERAFFNVVHIQHVPEFSDQDFIVLGGKGLPMVYPTAFDAIRGSEDEGKIEFSSYGNEYVLRKFTEEDSEWFTGFGLPLSPEMMEEIVAKDEEVGIEQAIEALTNEETGELLTVVYDVENLGSFFRVDGAWKAGTPELAEPFDGAVVTEIKYEKAEELVKRFDAGESMNVDDLADYELETEEDEEL